ncbi:MAG TPA: hypothetical protein VK445_05365 [Dissulfurispiraceae bacterium]|nr:hypothetical protein [Dissulfurispiraceae bacterium]
MEALAFLHESWYFSDMSVCGLLRILILCLLLCVVAALAVAQAGDEPPVNHSSKTALPKEQGRAADFEPLDLFLRDRHLFVSVINHGESFAGLLEFRVVAAESLLRQTDDVVFDRVVQVELTIRGGSVILVDLGDTGWPSDGFPALDHPQVSFGVLIDPNRLLVKDRPFRAIEQMLRIPCNAKIEKIAPDTYPIGFPALITLHGTFGNRQIAKRVLIRNRSETHELTVAEWKSDQLLAVLPSNMSEGDYEVVVACSESGCGRGYFTSNAIRLRMIRDPRFE